MLAVCIALAAVLAVTVSVGSRLLTSQARAHARREDLLLNQLLHAMGKPWQPAPATTLRDEQHDRDSEPRSWTATPEQLPVD